MGGGGQREGYNIYIYMCVCICIIYIYIERERYIYIYIERERYIYIERERERHGRWMWFSHAVFGTTIAHLRRGTADTEIKIPTDGSQGYQRFPLSKPVVMSQYSLKLRMYSVLSRGTLLVQKR